MVIWRPLVPISRLLLGQRVYIRKIASTPDPKMTQVHQQNLRYVCPDAIVRVDSDIFVKVCSADPHNYPDGDAIVAKLWGGPVRNCTASMVIKVSDDERNVDVELRKLAESDFHCELEVPIKANLHIKTRDAASVKDTYGDVLKVSAEKLLTVENIRAEQIELLSSEGNINCKGLLLGKCTTVETKNKGNISLDKLQGDKAKCRTTHGSITTNCSYVEASEFQTETGSLYLKNIHKKAVICIQKKGDLKMTGVHGNLKVLINEGSMNLQLSELHGENTIDANNLTSSIINISDNIENTTSLDISLIGDSSTPAISLDRTLEHLASALTENQQQLKLNDQEQSNKLKVTSNSSLTLGKSSWMDNICLEMTENRGNQS